MDPLDALDVLDVRVGRILRPDQLIGRLVVAAVNLGTRNTAGFQSEVLVLGVPDASGETILLAVEQDVPLGGRVY